MQQRQRLLGHALRQYLACRASLPQETQRSVPNPGQYQKKARACWKGIRGSAAFQVIYAQG